MLQQQNNYVFQTSILCSRSYVVEPMQKLTSKTQLNTKQTFERMRGIVSRGYPSTIYQKLCNRKGTTVQLHIKDYKKNCVWNTQLFCCFRRYGFGARTQLNSFLFICHKFQNQHLILVRCSKRAKQPVAFSYFFFSPKKCLSQRSHEM